MKRLLSAIAKEYDVTSKTHYCIPTERRLIFLTNSEFVNLFYNL